MCCVPYPKGVGMITESDVALAAAIGGPILGFNVRPPSNIVEKVRWCKLNRRNPC
jgi:translation initiation factor IF-2